MSLATLRTEIVAMMTTPLDATGVTWSDIATETLTRDHRIPAGEARLQVAVGAVQESGDSNVNYMNAEAEVKLHYHATTPALQQTWVETHLWAIGKVALDRSGWRASITLNDLEGGPTAGFPEKIGNIVTISYEAIVSIAL